MSEHNAQTLRPASGIHPEIITDLKTLFEFSSPQKIRKSLNDVFFDYLIANHDSLPEDFENIAGNFYNLIDFLHKAEERFKD
jgi:hypothetical protein